MQVDNSFTAYFIDTATAPGTPITGLSATITIIESDGTVAVNNAAMTELGLGWYKYVFTTMSDQKDYLYSCNPNSALCYRESGVTDRRLNNMDKSISDIRSGGVHLNLSGIQESIRNTSSRQTKELTTLIEDKAQEIKQKIELEKLDINPLVNKIEDIPGVDLSQLTQGIGIIKTQNTKLSQKLEEIKKTQEKDIKSREESEKEEEDKKENLYKIEADMIEDELEEIFEKEAEQIEKELEDQYKKEADQIEYELNSNK